MGWLNDAWNWTKDAAEWVYDAADDVINVVAEFGDEVSDILKKIGFGGKGGSTGGTNVQVTKPSTWPNWVWIALAGVGAVFILPRVLRALR